MPLYGQQFPILAPDGTAAAPSYGFGGSTGLGFYRVSADAGAVVLAANSVAGLRFGQGVIDIPSDAGLLRFGVGVDTVLTREAANTLALRNSTNAQAFNVYGSYTDASNHEGLKLRATMSAVDILAFASGTGGTRSLRFGINSNAQWMINTSGHWVTTADNIYDIGASGATRPRNVYVGSTLYTGGSIQAQGSIAAYTSTVLPAGGAAGNGYTLFKSTNFGVFGGSGAPTLSAAKGSLYLRSDGSGVADRMYVNTDGSTTWTAVATVA